MGCGLTLSYGVRWCKLGTQQLIAELTNKRNRTLAGHLVSTRSTRPRAHITAFDGTPLLISYVSAGGTGASISIPNNLQGQSPVVSIAGVNAADGSGWLFPNCRVTGIKPLDLKNNAYAMNEVSFSVFCPAGQAVGQLFQQSV